MDFGIARSVGGRAPAPAVGAHAARRRAQPTGTRRSDHGRGAIVGTVDYMAPEQARGEPVDQRADIYALGLIVSDMLLGQRRAGSGQSAIEELQRRIKQRPPALRTVDPQIPEAFERDRLALLEPDPAARFQTTAELVAALDRLDDNGEPLPLIRRLTPRLVAATAVLVIALLGRHLCRDAARGGAASQHDPVSVVIADFQNKHRRSGFDRTLEPMLKRALEGASFISAYDRSAHQRAPSACVRPSGWTKWPHARSRSSRVWASSSPGRSTAQGSGYDDRRSRRCRRSPANVIADAVSGAPEQRRGRSRRRRG